MADLVRRNGVVDEIHEVDEINEMRQIWCASQ